MKLRRKANSAGICSHCGKSGIEYGVENGSFWYYCLHCNKLLKKDEVLVNRGR